MSDTDRAKEYLCKIQKVDRLINRLTSMLAGLRASLTSKGCNYEDRVQTSMPSDALATAVAKVVDLEKEIDERIDELVDLKREALRTIERIENFDQQCVLIARYIEGMKWETIAADMDSDLRWVYRVHGQALLSLARILGPECQ